MRYASEEWRRNRSYHKGHDGNQNHFVYLTESYHTALSYAWQRARFYKDWAVVLAAEKRSLEDVLIKNAAPSLGIIASHLPGGAFLIVPPIIPRRPDLEKGLKLISRFDSIVRRATLEELQNNTDEVISLYEASTGLFLAKFY